MHHTLWEDSLHIRLTRHAKNRKRWRKISDEEISSAITEPDYIEDENGAKVACKKIGDKLIKIPYIKEGDVYIVLTVKFKKIKGGDE